MPLPAPGLCTRFMWALTVQLLRSGVRERPPRSPAFGHPKAPALELRPTVREIEAAEAMLSRFGVFEQVAAGYVAAHPVTASVLGEVRLTPPTSRLQSALSAWDIQVHRTLAIRTDAADLVRVGRVQALIASAAAIVTEAAGEKARSTPKWSTTHGHPGCFPGRVEPNGETMG